MRKTPKPAPKPQPKPTGITGEAHGYSNKRPIRKILSRYSR